MAIKGRRARPVRQEMRAPLATWAPMDLLGRLALKVVLDNLERKVSRAAAARQLQLAVLAPKDPKACMAQRVKLALKVCPFMECLGCTPPPPPYKIHMMCLFRFRTKGYNFILFFYPLFVFWRRHKIVALVSVTWYVSISCNILISMRSFVFLCIILCPFGKFVVNSLLLLHLLSMNNRTSRYQRSKWSQGCARQQGNARHQRWKWHSRWVWVICLLTSFSVSLFHLPFPFLFF